MCFHETATYASLTFAAAERGDARAAGRTAIEALRCAMAMAMAAARRPDDAPLAHHVARAAWDVARAAFDAAYPVAIATGGNTAAWRDTSIAALARPMCGRDAQTLSAALAALAAAL